MMVRAAAQPCRDTHAYTAPIDLPDATADTRPCVSMSAVLPWLLIGDKAAAKDREFLRRQKVRYVLNVTPPKTEGGVVNFFEKEATLEYKRLSLRDVATDTILPHVSAAVEFLQRVRIRADGRVLVHCNEGKSRSVAIVAAFLIRACMARL